jgi:hypothetical protein
MLEEGPRNFDPKAVAPLLEVFHGIVAELDLRTGADRRKAAKIVMRLAYYQADLAKVRLDAIRLIRKKGRAAGAPSEKSPAARGDSTAGR